ncbi:hypothetical protein E4U43_000998 [Claviceps pusilla]|uniref:Bud22 domain-containing protein n=1 Tax=Claviceps pusilla TaxID=123648 RepID=A0A9P7NGB3_9HYPO|nr:hypothetical protein E4U43_000998 [Claviceps pusilla]
MPKRKRESGLSLHDILEKYQDEVFRALKTSKGFERQRLSKKLREQGITPDKTQRLEREIAVLKSLDLHQTARAHLYLSLLKVKSIAASPDLPDEIRRGVSKPDLPAEEQAALHNVTSNLYNKESVRQVTGRAVKAVCSILDVALPEASKRSRKDKCQAPDEQSADRNESSLANRATLDPNSTASKATNGGPPDEEESEFEGFSSHDDEPTNIWDESDSDMEENDYEKLNDLLGSASEEEEEDWNDEKYAQFRGKETANLDDISVSGSDMEDSEAELDSQVPSRSPSPPVEKKQKTAKKASSAIKPGQIGGSTFLPSLMGGYISGSESASDIEEAKPKKRRGQRARQAIWEKKYGTGAKHLQKPSHKGGRDSGWDMRRGAVDGDAQGKKTPWKKGIQRPAAGHVEAAPPPKPRKRDDEGALHPSWEARKKARQTQKSVAFTGEKVVFD